MMKLVRAALLFVAAVGSQVSAQTWDTSGNEVVVRVAPVGKARWRSICRDCTGAIDSLIELLQGRFSKGHGTCLPAENRPFPVAA